MSIDAFNVISGICTIAALVFALFIYIKDKSILKNIESNVIGTINALDKLAAMANVDEYSKKEMGIHAEAIRDQTIAVLKSFSNREERYRTFDFGTNGKDIEERIKERKESLGFDYTGCIVPGQHLISEQGLVLVENICKNTRILAASEDGSDVSYTPVTAINRYHVNN